MTAFNILQSLAKCVSSINGTNLITLYIPANYNLSLIIKQLNTELSTASNIKDKNVRKSVITSLKRSIENISSLPVIAPSNGLVLCAGENGQHL
jgi:peptide subunit release factor 1 (eRF1)